MRLLHVIHTLDPRSGGLVACVRAFVPELARHGHPQEIVTLDAPDDPWGLDGADAVHRLGPAPGALARAPRLRPWLRAAAARFDLVVAHGLWQDKTAAVRTALAGTGTPYVVYPHGMLDPWFNRTYPLKHFKKILYWRLREAAVLRDAAAVLYTCEEERLLGRTAFRPYAARELVAPLGLPAPPAANPAETAAFLARCPGAAGLVRARIRARSTSREKGLVR